MSDYVTYFCDVYILIVFCLCRGNTHLYFFFPFFCLEWFTGVLLGIGLIWALSSYNYFPFQMVLRLNNIDQCFLCLWATEASQGTVSHGWVSYRITWLGVGFCTNEYNATAVLLELMTSLCFNRLSRTDLLLSSSATLYTVPRLQLPS